MATDWDEIAERLAERTEFQTNLEDVFNEEDLKKAIESSFDTTGRRKTLEKHKKELFDTEEIETSVVDNVKTKISDADTTEELDFVQDFAAKEVEGISSAREREVERVVAVRERELFKEKAPEDITAEDIRASPRKNVGKFASDFDLSVEEAIEVLEREGAVVTDGKTFSKP